MVPPSLRRWFVVHFAADYLFALPLMIYPVPFLKLIGWEVVDPLATRLVAAALFGIGGMSLLERKAGLDAFMTMLNLKLLWSAAAIVGIAITICQGAPQAAWLFLAIFVSFFLLWLFYRIRLPGRKRGA